MNSSTQLADLAAEWRDARALYPLYLALAREFVLETPPCADLDANLDAPPEESIHAARDWFETLDGQIQVHQLRHFLQMTTLADESRLRLLLVRHLRKRQHSPAERDKVDFLLVQYFSHVAPPHLDDSECDLAYVAQALEPIIGAVNFSIPDWLAPLEQIIESAATCRRLTELFSAHVLEEGRKIKGDAGPDYFLPIALVAFTRFNFLIRRIFFRLMHEDLNTIHDGLRELERRGVRMLDCRRAHFSHQEPTERLRMICHSWKVMFHAEYSTGQPLKMLTELRTVVDEALAHTPAAAPASTGFVDLVSPPTNAPADSPAESPDQALAAAAGQSDSGVTEFDISAPQHQPDED